MNLDNLIKKLVSESFFPIRVEGSAFKSKDSGFVFVGDLDEFLKAAKALKAEIVLVVNAVLSEDDFKYEFDEENGDYDDESDGGESEPIYLPSVMPSLSEFKKYMGQDYAYKLSVITMSNSLDFFIQEAWWDEFIERYFEAVEKIKENRNASWLSQQAEHEAKQKEMLERLKMLISDSAFINLRTQKAMLAYALEKIPELEDIDRATLQSEIQNLNAKIEAKGLGRKK